MARADTPVELSASRVEIVEAFTRWLDLGTGPGLDGVEVYVQPRLNDGQPVRSGGGVLVELYAFNPASGDPKGRRAELWSIALETEEQRGRHWNRATEMYELRLQLSESSLPLKPGEKHVLVVTHNSAAGMHLSDRMMLDVPLARSITSAKR